MRSKGESGGDLPGQAMGFRRKEDEWMILSADVSKIGLSGGGEGNGNETGRRERKS